MELTSTMLFDNTPPELLERRGGGTVPLFVSCGLGVNSVAGLMLLRQLNDVPDAILFADTGGEKQATYDYKQILDTWLAANGFPTIITVRRTVDHARQKHEVKYDTLEEECLVKKCLPSIAYFGRSCSIKWKQDPQEKWANNAPGFRARWNAGLRCVKTIFYDADEPGRATIFHNKKWAHWYPLLDRDWGRDECLRAIADAGLPAPLKSSCFFCPEMTEEEIFALRDSEPDKLERALAIEDNSEHYSIKGLGKHQYSWRDLVEGRVTLPLAPRPRLACMCDSGEPSMFDDDDEE